jgi:predicted AAA+ superfamily ATPase
MINREQVAELLEIIGEYPAVGILGPRQVGKTTLAKHIAASRKSIYLDLELPDDRAKLVNPSLFFNSYSDHLIILDEIQIQQELFAILRALIDQDRCPGRFLLLGSVSPALMRHAAESLAGRIAYIDLHPLTSPEVQTEDPNLHWLRGGFPLSYLAKSHKSSERWRQNFIRSYVEKDLMMLGLPNNPSFHHKFWTMAAHLNAKLSNYNQMSRSLQVSNTTVRDYYDMFINTFLIYELAPYYRNLKKRLVKSPKYYLNDTGVLHSFLGISTLDALLGHPEAGFSWETYVINQVRAILKPPYGLSFYRTHQGAEIDLLITRSDEPYISCEIKLTNAPKVSKGMNIAIGDVGTERNYIITHSSDRYPISENIEVIPVKTFLEAVVRGLE